MRGALHRRHSTVISELNEKERLDINHTIHQSFLEPNESRLIGSHLASIHATGRRSRVLDVGTVRGLLNQGTKNPSLISLGSNVIHVKCMLLEIPNYQSFIERLAVILKQNGLMIIVEPEPTFHSAHGELPKCMRTWDTCVQNAFANRSIDISTPSRMLVALEASGVYACPVYVSEVGIPCAGYMTGECHQLARAGRMHSTVIAANMKAILPRLRGYGYDDNDLKRLQRGCLTEINNPSSRFYQRLFAFCAHKVTLRS
ncbi:hypothetical protein TREMEDRAFT_65417 [Tremella mesenterica DSM 1558]|uniref:uncharacterized protein n=1 Tax=Tremella mesenterica (strain ATCC 24925 / CBS 8224 / DSM 1558 / NBRC 9311 / NRRL Y-6157 / RJB 2259-6 / UBC 559-6) TaxID=578456 RepID=UPI00032C88F7|nr:uncharacterized protein TREMEDRAFT_65417 [Tremella mesenterica DSM 1558]EIW66547.1 hypothetical protein TREMEDRAFT_65417 [Tremella mesenterica DSM 1558]